MNPKKAQELLLAMTSAYVWIASADEGVTFEEIAKFEKTIIKSPFATHFDMADVRHTFKDMVEVFLQDFNYGIDLTQKRLRAYGDQPLIAREIMRLCRAAIVSDGQIKDPEEIALAEISKILNLSEA